MDTHAHRDRCKENTLPFLLPQRVASGSGLGLLLGGWLLLLVCGQRATSSEVGSHGESCGKKKKDLENVLGTRELSAGARLERRETHQLYRV